MQKKNRKIKLPKTEDIDYIGRCHDDPWFFMTEFVYTLERKEGLKKFPDYPYLKDFVTLIQDERLLIVLKSRQMLITWTVMAFIVWDCILFGSSDVLVISKREAEAKELIQRAKFIYNNLPETLKITIGYDNKNMLEFNHRKSRIISLPSSPDIGRSYAPKRIFWDEMAFTPFDEEVFQSLQPALDGGGSFIGVSSSNGMNTKHGQLCLNYKEQGFKKLALHYSMHPLKDENWLKEAKKGISIERWNQEQELSLETSGNRVYERFSAITHVIDWHYEEALSVYRAIDFGYHTPVVLWLQVTVNDEVIVFNEWIGENNTISELFHHINIVDAKIGITEDDVEMTYCDPAGKAVTDKGISSVDYLEENGIKLSYRSSSVCAGIALVREKLMDASGNVFLKISRNCKRTISDFMHYSKRNKSEEPKKDNVSDHTMDALRYFFVNYFDSAHVNSIITIPPKVIGIQR
ncbi:hypothetical protein ACFL4Z_02230 [candidate division KSB1 bacterium]